MRELIRDTVFSRLAWLADEFSERPHSGRENIKLITGN